MGDAMMSGVTSQRKRHPDPNGDTSAATSVELFCERSRRSDLNRGPADYEFFRSLGRFLSVFTSCGDQWSHWPVMAGHGSWLVSTSRSVVLVSTCPYSTRPTLDISLVF